MNEVTNNQLDAHGRLQHFLTIEGLSKSTLTEILDRAASFIEPTTQIVSRNNSLQGKTIANLFFEASTRTRTTFELAAKYLGADVLNLNIAVSATQKGETLLDTVLNLQAMQCDLFVIRHHEEGAQQQLAHSVDSVSAIINAGDGCHAHPSQAMLDMYTIRHYKKDFSALKVAIIGDIAHSRVARSQIQALKTFGVDQIRVIAPKALLPARIDELGVQVFDDLTQGLRDVDVVITLRIQRERMQHGAIPDTCEFFHQYGLTDERLAHAKPDAIVMHPGPINRGVEIASSVADGKQSVILHQVRFGIAVRMALMSILLEH